MKEFYFSLVLSASFWCLVTSPASAATWHFAWVGNEETRYFFDADTVDKNRDVVTVWVKTVQTNAPESDGSWSTAYRWKMNCSKRTIQTMTASTYDMNGKFIKSYPNPGADNPAVPDSTGEAMLKIACESNFPRDSSGEKYFKLSNNDVFQATKNYVEYLKSQVDTAPQ